MFLTKKTWLKPLQLLVLLLTLIYLVGSSLLSSSSWSGQNRPQVSPCQSLSGIGSSAGWTSRPSSREILGGLPARPSTSSCSWDASTQSVLDLTMTAEAQVIIDDPRPATTGGRLRQWLDHIYCSGVSVSLRQAQHRKSWQEPSQLRADSLFLVWRTKLRPSRIKRQRSPSVRPGWGCGGKDGLVWLVL